VSANETVCCSSAAAVVALDGSGIVPSNKPQRDGTLVNALARAWRWQGLLDGRNGTSGDTRVPP
jgi:hypothetical protein